MIGTVLDQAQKLFGRGFLIAAFVPSLLFVTVLAYLWWGFEALNATVTAWTQKGLKEAGFELLIALVAVYLLAYVLYGVRGAVHQLYQGQWPIPLKWIRPLGMALARRTMRRYQATLREKEAALDDPAWAISFDFAETYAAVEYTTEEATIKLQRISATHEDILERLGKGQEWQERSYSDTLREARLLQANRGRLPRRLQEEVDKLVAKIKATYQEREPLREVTIHLNALALREWGEAYSDLADNFPDDERWLRPTRLGNIVSVMELHPLNRYGIELSSMWPRLKYVIPQDARVRIGEANIYLDFTVLMSLLFFAAAANAIIGGVCGPSRPLIFQSLFAVMSLLSSWLFYHLAIQATRTYALEIQANVDLFRLRLLEALEIEKPGSPEEERKVWNEIRDFIVQGDLPTEHVRFRRASKETGEHNSTKHAENPRAETCDNG